MEILNINGLKTRHATIFHHNISCPIKRIDNDIRSEEPNKIIAPSSLDLEILSKQLD